MTSMSARARRADCDQLAARVGLDEASSRSLLEVSDVLASNVSLRHSLTDQNATAQARAQLVGRLFSGKVSQPALDWLAQAVAWDWSSGRTLVDAIERQGVRGLLAAQDAAGTLDDVRDELFRFGRTVVGSPELDAALEDRRAPREARQGIVDRLLAKASPLTRTLASRALGQHGFVDQIQSYLDLASDMRQRQRAIVRTAVALTAEQREAIQAQLNRIYARQIDLDVAVDPTLLGGVTISVGDEVIDGSIARKLADAKQELGSDH